MRSWSRYLLLALVWMENTRAFIPVSDHYASSSAVAARTHSRSPVELALNANDDGTISTNKSISRREAFLKGAGMFSAVIAGGALSPPPSANALTASSAAATVATSTVKFPSDNQKGLAALSLGTLAVAGITSNPPPGPAARRVVPKTKFIVKLSWRQQLLRVARTLRRALRISVLAAPVAALYPFCKNNPARYNKWLKFFLKQSERGGAVVIKMCQWASSRPDIFGTDFCEVTKKLQDSTTPHKWTHTEKVIEKAYGKNWRDKLKIKKDILGSGCIAQVYKGTIMREDGEEDVAIKVMHPKVREGIDYDLDILRFLANSLQRLPFGIGEKLQWNNLDGMVEEFAVMLKPQLDLCNEEENIIRFNEYFKDDTNIVFPKNIPDYKSHPDVLVESFCEGVSVEQFCRENEADKDLRAKLCDVMAETMCNMIFRHNFVHGDLHPGNIFVTPDKKMVLLDCGIVNEYSDADHDLLINIIAAFIRMDGKRAAELMADDSNRRLKELGQGTQNVEEYIRDIENLSKTPRKTDFVFEKIGTYANYIFNAAASHQVKMNPTFISMALAVKVQEGVAFMLNPACELVKVANPIILDCEAERFQKGGLDRLVTAAEDKLRRWKTNLEREVTKVEEAQGVAPSEGREAEEALRAASVVAPA